MVLGPVNHVGFMVVSSLVSRRSVVEAGIAGVLFDFWGLFSIFLVVGIGKMLKYLKNVLYFFDIGVKRSFEKADGGFFG